MNTNTNKTYENAIQDVLINAVSNPFGDTVESETESTIAEKVKGQKYALLNLVPSDKQADAEDIISSITYEYETAFYAAGFRQATKLMLDCLVGGVV